MAGLRKKQKEKRETAIIEAAKQLIGEKGYRNTSIEEISEKAEVGPATVYNYFNSKAGIFIAIFRKELEIILQNGVKVIVDLPATPEEAIYKLAEAQFGDLASRYSKKLVREIFAFVIIERFSAGQEMKGMDNALRSQLLETLKVFEKRGHFASGITFSDVAFVVYPLIMTDLMALFINDDMTTADFLKSIKMHLYLAFKGLKK